MRYAIYRTLSKHANPFKIRVLEDHKNAKYVCACKPDRDVTGRNLVPLSGVTMCHWWCFEKMSMFSTLYVTKALSLSAYREVRSASHKMWSKRSKEEGEEGALVGASNLSNPFKGLERTGKQFPGY